MTVNADMIGIMEQAEIELLDKYCTTIPRRDEDVMIIDIIMMCGHDLLR